MGSKPWPKDRRPLFTSNDPDDDGPDTAVVISGRAAPGEWAGRLNMSPGAVRMPCATCGLPVWIDRQNQALMDDHPGVVSVSCLECAVADPVHGAKVLAGLQEAADRLAAERLRGPA